MPPSARTAATVFFVNGLTLCTYIVRTPALKQELGLTNADLGLVGVLFAVAAIGAMQIVGRAAHRWGTTNVLRVLLVVMPVLLAGVGCAQDEYQFTCLATLLGAAHGATDAAMNTYALGVEQQLGRSVMNRCHAAWSIGAVTASLLAAALAPRHLDSSLVLGISGLLLVPAGLLLGTTLSSAPPPTRSSTVRPRWSGPALLLGITGTLLMICEGAALGWGSLLVRETKDASLAVAALTVTAYTASQALARLGGDRLTEHYGSAMVFRIGGGTAALGLTLAVFAPNASLALAGFAGMGVGMASLIPLTFSEVGRLGQAAPEIVAGFTTFTYGGILLGPALIGGVAEVTGLTQALGLLIPLLIGLTVLHPFRARADENVDSRR